MKSPSPLPILLSLTLLYPHLAFGEARTDGTMGAVRNLSGHFEVPQDLGTLKGQNLFHSFQHFQVRTGESATFTGENSIKNVISRVTGDQASSINGKLSSKIGKADFYFINPNGVTFGQGAQIDMPAAFKVSTASELRFPDGVYSAVDPKASTLSVEKPEAFGFLGNQSGKIALELAKLTAKPKREVAFIGRKLDVTQSTVTAEQGQVRLEAVGAGNSKVLVDTAATEAHGAIKLLNSTLDVSGNGSGTLTVRGGDIRMAGTSLPDDGGILANNTGTIDATPKKGIDIQADTLTISDGGRIRTNVEGHGKGADVKIRVAGHFDLNDSTVRSSLRPGSSGQSGIIKVAAKSLSLNNLSHSESSINTNSYTSEKAGSINVSVSDALILENSAYISSDTLGNGNSGLITITADTINLDHNASIEASAWNDSTGNAGQVLVNVGKILTLDNESSIYASTYNNASGSAGLLSIKSSGDLSITNNSSMSTQSINHDLPSISNPHAGNIEVEAKHNLILLDGGAISTTTMSHENSGSIIVKAGSILMDTTDSLTGIWSMTRSNGKAGDISVDSNGRLDILNDSVIKSTSNGHGDTGNMIVKSAGMTLDSNGSFGGIYTWTFDSGNAGNVTVQNAGLLEIFDGSIIGSKTDLDGHAGNVFIQSGTLSIDAQTNQVGNTGLFSGPADIENGKGKAGSIDVETSGAIAIVNDGSISNITLGANDAGDIRIKADSLTIKGEDQTLTGIYTTTLGKTGQGGNIYIDSPGTLSLTQGDVIDSSTYSEAKAGDISINVGKLQVSGSQKSRLGFFEPSGIYSEATILSNGQPGNVNITANQEALISDQGLISIKNSGNAEIPGDRTPVKMLINTPSLTIDGGVITGQTKGNVAAGSMIIHSDSTSIRQSGKITSETSSSGDGGVIEINSNNLILSENSHISTSTSSTGNAGKLLIHSNTLSLDHADLTSEAKAKSKGEAGTVVVNLTKGATLTKGGVISSSTFGQGNGGSVTLNAESLLIDGQDQPTFTGIASQSEQGATGHAGDIVLNVVKDLNVIHGGSITSETASNSVASHQITGLVQVTAKEVLLAQKGRITASTSGPDRAGSVQVSTKYLKVKGQGSAISSEATNTATGNAGAVSVNTNFKGIGVIDLSHGGQITSRHLGKGDAGTITLAGKTLQVNQSIITTEAQNGQGGSILIHAPGQLNLTNSRIATAVASEGDAGTITVRSDDLRMQHSAISTEAWDGLGGDIHIAGGRLMRLQDSEIQTSVLGRTNGNGGDIEMSGDSLILETGLIQANTAAPNAHGGDIRVAVEALVPSGSMLQVGGDQVQPIQRGRFGYNIIQAAAPDGVSGAIDLGPPQLDLSGALAKIAGAPFDLSALTRDYCILSIGSSLTRGGRGGMPSTAEKDPWVFP
jgi:filamentous hemagglutinin family protein